MSDQNETYVRERVSLNAAEFPGGQNGMLPSIRINIQIHEFLYSTFYSWAEARTYVESLEEAIRQLEKEIAWIERQPVHKVSMRILAHLQAALTDLQRGLKPGGKA